jgi:hypothetical protein
MTVEPFWAQCIEPTLRQRDLLPACLVPIPELDAATEDGPREGTAIEYDLIVLTQSCDLEQRKVRLVATCPIFPLYEFEAVNPAFARKGRWNDVLKGRIEGLHLLASPIVPHDNRQALVVDFREIYSLPYDYLLGRATHLGSRWQLKSPFLEHFSQAFARFFMRVGLPSTIPEFR